MRAKRWVIASPDTERVRVLSRETGYTPLTAAVLSARGIDTPQAAADYLSCDVRGLHDPFGLTDMDKAVKVVREVIDRGEKMVVYGDYDVDGITATCTLVDYLRSKGAKCEYYIPNRLTDGYGLTRPAMEQLYEQGTRLLITVDSGITANEEIAVARELGMQVVITDHHECHENLPDAQAVVDCKRTDDTYPFSSLAGVGVAFKLICALEGDTLSMLDRYADLVALGTVADVMPIVGENRIIVAEGLKKLSVTANIGLEMLLREAGMKNRRLTSSTISYVLAPRINAAGRMGKAELAAELFLTKDPVRAQALAAELCEQNKLRQNEENKILEQTLTRLRKYAETHVTMAELVPQLHIDCMVQSEWLTQENIESLSVLEPYGMKNAEPVFCMKNMTVEEITPLSSDRHVRLSLIKDGKRFSAIWFGIGAGGLGFVEGNTVDAAFHLEINEFRGRRSVQLTICDVQLSDCEHLADQKILNLYNTLMQDGPLTAREARLLLPDRKDLVAVWRHVTCRAEDGRLSVPDGALSRRVAWESRRDINIGKLFVCLDVFQESGLISYHFKEGMLNILLKPYEGKADISGSVVLATLQSMAG